MCVHAMRLSVFASVFGVLSVCGSALHTVVAARQSPSTSTKPTIVPPMRSHLSQIEISPPLQNFQQSRGFGFVRYLNKDDAERAIEKLDGKVSELSRVIF